MKKIFILASIFIFVCSSLSLAQTVKTYYSNGKVNVAKSYYPNGKMEELVVNYSNGSPKLVKKYYSNGNIKAVLRYNTKDELNGPYKYYWPNGQIKVQGTYKNGKHVGTIKKYSMTGAQIS